MADGDAGRDGQRRVALVERHAREGEPPIAGTIGRWVITPTRGGIALAVDVIADDGLYARRLDCSPGTVGWSELWRGAGIEEPADLSLNGDFGAALGELQGKRLAASNLAAAA